MRCSCAGYVFVEFCCSVFRNLIAQEEVGDVRSQALHASSGIGVVALDNKLLGGSLFDNENLQTEEA